MGQTMPLMRLRGIWGLGHETLEREFFKRFYFWCGFYGWGIFDAWLNEYFKSSGEAVCMMGQKHDNQKPRFSLLPSDPCHANWAEMGKRPSEPMF